MGKKFIVLNGMSTAGIIRDVQKVFRVSDADFLVVTDNADAIPPPEGFAYQAIGEISTDDLLDVEYLIGNGGRTRQLIPLIAKLSRLMRETCDAASPARDTQIWDIQNAQERTTENLLLGVIASDGTIREPKSS